jgi:hypothetical protein
MSRPQQPSFHPQAGSGGNQFSSVHGPYGGGAYSGGSRPGAGGSGERHVWNTPNGGTVVGGGGRNSFTGPGGNTYSGGGGHYAYRGPNGTTAFGGGRGGSITGAGGNSISGGEHGHVVIGPNGNVHGSGGRGAAFNGPNGEAIAGSHGAFTAGQNGVIGHGGRGIAGEGENGAFAAGSRGIAGRGENGAFAAGERGIAGRGENGEFAAGGRGAIAAGPYGAAAAGSHFAAGRGLYGGYAGGTRFVGASDLRGQGAYVRNNFGCYNCFQPGWYGHYPGAWAAAGLVAGATAWSAASWPTCQSYVGYASNAAPYYYDYGNSITYQGDNVYYGDQVAATQEDYAAQAQQIAQAAPEPAADVQWQPLGVFAMAVGDETSSNDIVQLAIDQSGAVRGNYYNAISDTAVPLSGSLDKKSQRVAWTINGKNNIVYETGLYNLTQDQTTMLVHFGKDNTQQYKLFRVQQQDESAGQSSL